MTINIKGPELRELKPRILVLGVGGAGGNALNGMIEAGMQGVEFVAINTDAQHLLRMEVPNKLLIGRTAKGHGAGGNPEKGEQAAYESELALKKIVEETDLAFVTCVQASNAKKTSQIFSDFRF